MNWLKSVNLSYQERRRIASVPRTEMGFAQVRSGLTGTLRPSLRPGRPLLRAHVEEGTREVLASFADAACMGVGVLSNQSWAAHENYSQRNHCHPWSGPPASTPVAKGANVLARKIDTAWAEAGHSARSMSARCCGMTNKTVPTTDLALPPVVVGVSHAVVHHCLKSRVLLDEDVAEGLVLA
jgi:hypothetical protein